MIPLWFLHRNESIPISGSFPDCIPSDHSGRWRTKVWFRGVLVQGFGWFEAAWSSSDDHRSSQSIDGQICSGTRFVIQVSSLCAMIVCVIIIPFEFFISLHSFRSIDILLLMYIPKCFIFVIEPFRMLSDQREPTHIPAILDVKVWKVATMCQRDQGQIRWWCFFSVSRIYPILFYTVGVVVSFGQSSIRHPAPLPPRAVAELQKHIKTLDTQYDACNDAWATGEADKFTGEKLLDIIVLLASLAVK